MKSYLIKTILTILAAVLIVGVVVNIIGDRALSKKPPSFDNIEFEETTQEPFEETDPACNGIHSSWRIDIEGHYREACKYCGEGAVELTAHSFITDNGVLTCKVCRYVPECGGVHDYVFDINGHYKDACPLCSAESTPIADHIFSGDGDPVCAVCGYTADCQGIHPYISNRNGHSIEGCSLCGFEAYQLTVHSTFFDVEAAEDANIYKATCSICGYVYSHKVPLSINKYLTPVDLNVGSSYASHNSIINELYELTCSGEHVQHIWLRERYLHPNGSGILAGGGSQMSDNMNIGQAKYMVIQMSTNKIPPNLYFTFSTTGYNYDSDGVTGIGAPSVSANFYINCSAAIQTYVLDLSLLGKFYAPDENGDYVLDTFYLGMSGADSSHYIDIYYIAFVDSWDEVAELVTDDTVVRFTDLNGTSETVKPDGTCAHSCSYHWVTDANIHYKALVCDICGYKDPDQIVSQYGEHVIDMTLYIRNGTRMCTICDYVEW